VQFPWELSRHAFKIEGVSTIARFADGQMTVKFDIAANVDRSLHTEFSWSQAGITKDFGVVVHGEDAAVALTHSEGLGGAEWPIPEELLSVEGSPYTYPTRSTPPTALDLTAWASEFISHEMSSECELILDNEQ